MRKGLHPQMQQISYVTQSGRSMHVMMTKLHSVGNVYHLKAKREMAESVGQIAKFRQPYEKGIPEKHKLNIVSRDSRLQKEVFLVKFRNKHEVVECN